jgi:hypothetical protein
MAALAAALLATLAGAAYVEDVALDEAIRANIGPPIAASAFQKDALVATSAGALALLSFRTGNVKWRFVLPAGAILPLLRCAVKSPPPHVC